VERWGSFPWGGPASQENSSGTIATLSAGRRSRDHRVADDNPERSDRRRLTGAIEVSAELT